MTTRSFTRRHMSLATGSFAAVGGRAQARVSLAPKLILAPSNLGLRPRSDGAQQGAWRAPEALMAAGLQSRIHSADVTAFARPPYELEAQPGTRIRNGHTIRSFSLEFAGAVRATIEAGGFPLVIGGDCSILLGCLYGARLAGGRGLVHVDGHSDFFHPGNYDTSARLGSAAGMDLALATGRGEALLTKWPYLDDPLVRDEDAIQLGERDALNVDYDQFYGDVARTGINRLIVQDVLRMGIGAAAVAVVERLGARGLDRAWLHVDLDVLDQAVMPAVDSPGSPGLDFDQLGALLRTLLESGRIVGADITIYDPEHDPEGVHAAKIVTLLGEVFAP